MDLKLLNPEIQEFINSNIGKKITKLALQKNPFPEMEWITILNQIEAKTKSKDKLPNWFATKNIIYPSKISVEQTSSEKTAYYKSEIVSGESLIDLTGGFGVDDYYFAKKLKNVIHCEISPELSQIVKHNFEQFNIKNISCHCGNSLEILPKLNTKFDCIYIDPSRRNNAKGKVFMLKDCLPNVPEHLDYLFQYSDRILIKTAPLLDISEVKELLWELHKGYFGKILLKTINIVKEKRENFEFNLDENYEIPEFGLPEKYLYEPNAAIMKSAGFDEVGTFYKLKKLHKHSHLYTNSEIISFPGRVFEIENSFQYHKKEMKNYLERKQFNITTRNFPDTVESIRKKWKIKEGGNQYCFFTTDENENKIVLICKKIK